MSIYVDIKKRLGGFQLDAQFEVGSETLALLGASGCGKSMTLKCLAGVEKPDSGVIVANGRTLFDSRKDVNLPPQQRRVGMLFQNCSLFPNMTVRENIMAALTRAKGAANAEQGLRTLLSRFYMEGLEEHYPAQLSGGQQQRAALIRIMAVEPEILLLDEPFSALDSYLRWQLELELAQTLEEFTGTAVLVSHDSDEVYRLCEKVCPMTGGRTDRTYETRELFATPSTLTACLLSSCKNYSRVRRTGERTLYAIDWNSELKCAAPIPDGTDHIGVRAHYIKPVEGGGENVISCHVTRVIDDLFSTIIMAAPDSGTPRRGFSLLRVELPRQRAGGVKAGDLIRLHIDGKDIIPLTA